MSRSLMGTGKLFTIDEDTIHINSGKGNFSLRSIGEKDQSYNCPLSFTVYRFLLHRFPSARNSTFNKLATRCELVNLLFLAKMFPSPPDISQPL